MNFHLHRISLSRAEEVKPLVYELVSKMARVSGIGIIQSRWTCSVKVNLHDGVVKGLPRRVNGVPVVYDHITNIVSRSLL